MNKKNYLSHAVFIALFLVGTLLLLSLIPTPFFEKYGFRPIDILSDIRPDENLKDSLIFDSIPQAVIDTNAGKRVLVPEGIIPIEHYCEQNSNMKPFFEALQSIDTLNRPVRIAFYGDSFIEGDILCGDFRRCMQDTFGGKGVGFVPIASEVAGFRTTINHSYKGWITQSLIKSTTKENYFGINGCYYQPIEGAWVKYSGIKNNSHLASFEKIRLLYQNQNNDISISYKTDTLPYESVILPFSKTESSFDINSHSSSVSFSFPASSQLHVHGVSLESSTGVIVDNFSMRGHAGTGLSRITAQTLHSFDSLLHYNLIILQYGLNVMSANQLQYTQYEKNMITVIQHLQKSFPNASFLLIGIADRSILKQGSYVTMPGVHGMIASQKRICAETKISFWNLFEAMGGENSIVEFVNSTPPKANKDYTHLNFNGGRVLGELLFKTLMFEKAKYEASITYVRKPIDTTLKTHNTTILSE